MSRKLEDLDPRFKPTVEAFLEDCETQGIDVIVTCTRRSLEEQAVLYAQGRTAPGHIVTNAKPGQSAHNVGLAFDVVPIAHGKCVWDESNPVWQQLGDIGRKHGLVWLGEPDSPFHEDPHFQMANWHEVAK